MARNKYPEQTVELILETARRLFLEKGYEATTIQDIVDGLGGLTKGAVYHHFKSKADIMNALGDKLFAENDPFRAVEGRADGSIRTDYAPELAELIPLLTSLWLAPTVYPATAEGLRRKFRLIGEMLTALGLPLVDESVLSLADEYISKL